MRRLLLILCALVAVAMLAACGSSSSTTPPPSGNDPTVDVPGIGGDTGKTVTVTAYFPTPTREGTGAMGDGQCGMLQYVIKLSEFTEGKDLSALTNADREKVEATANGIAWFLYNSQATMPSGEGYGTWEHVFPWGSGDTTFYRNVQAVTWLGLLQYVELYDLYAPSDVTRTPVNDQVLADLAEFLDNDALAPSGTNFLGDRYNVSMAASDTDANTNADRPYAYEVILLSRAANVYNNPEYQYMAETWFNEIDNEFTGAEFATRLVTNRKSLSLWDAGGYLWAAVLTGFTEFADYDSGTDVGKTALWTAVTDEDDGMMQEIAIRRADWENVLYGGWDYTNEGWAFLPAPLSELGLYAAFTTEAAAYYDEALDNLKDNTFRHRSYGYYGYLDHGRLYDDSQYNGYALIGLGHADQNDFMGSDANLMRVMDGALEWFNVRVGADILANTDIDLDGFGDAGAVRSQYRGTFQSSTGTFYYENTAEALSGMVIGAEQFFRFPDIPLP